MFHLDSAIFIFRLILRLLYQGDICYKHIIYILQLYKYSAHMNKSYRRLKYVFYGRRKYVHNYKFKQRNSFHNYRGLFVRPQVRPSLTLCNNSKKAVSLFRLTYRLTKSFSFTISTLDVVFVTFGPLHRNVATDGNFLE